MRGHLSDARLEQIHNLIPSTIKNVDRLFAGPRVVTHDLIHKTTLHVALVCFEDACNRYHLARLALHEAYACLYWYREDTNQTPNEVSAVTFGKFYADYNTLLLYAAAEDIAEGVLHFMNIQEQYAMYVQDPTKQALFKSRRISSKAAMVGTFLHNMHTQNPVAVLVSQLHRSTDWNDALKYRNTWVHEKPPIIEGKDIQYRRESRAVDDGYGGRVVAFGGGHEPEYTIDQIVSMCHQATDALYAFLTGIIDIVIAKRTSIGERFVD